jgi:hypothetical protein
LDLEELDLIDLEDVRFLNACESAGVSILHFSAYIRGMQQESEVGRKSIQNRGEGPYVARNQGRLTKADAPQEEMKRKRENNNDSEINAD